MADIGDLEETIRVVPVPLDDPVPEPDETEADEAPVEVEVPELVPA